ncbi:hypothetical protein SLEP1_g10037 [Rubroshorea leprosula]|uniref:Protein PAIR1 n=1 Tax=Rubroshorea leprosula TaxID=152421 RepID=A0AAV5II58_9ROSI|nr:hypothetical protein SLEP1_g10037 [Rubroshorea leprosula]
MKLKINKACDLSSISVLPPHSRRSNTVPSGPQASQLRSQPSQQSFSLGFSPQPAFFSQISQNSFDEVLTTDLRFGSQERENSVKKASCLPQINTTREENQMPISRSSANQMRKWNASSASEHRYQISEELEHRLGMIGTSINRFGMILDSVQSDVMQVNKGTKELLLENGIRQRLISEDASLQLMIKGLEDIKTNLDGVMKSISDQLSNRMCLDKLEQIFLLLSTLPTQIEASLFKLQNKLQNFFTKEIQAILGSLKTLKQNSSVAAAIPLKYTGSCDTSERKQQPLKKYVASSILFCRHCHTHLEWFSALSQPLVQYNQMCFTAFVGNFEINPAMHSKAHVQSVLPPKTEMGGWNLVKAEQSMFTRRSSFKENKKKGVSCTQQGRECRVTIESNEEIDEGFSCFLGGKERDTTINSLHEAKQQADRILRRARRQKRKYCNPIIIN